MALAAPSWLFNDSRKRVFFFDAISVIKCCTFVIIVDVRSVTVLSFSLRTCLEPQGIMEGVDLMIVPKLPSPVDVPRLALCICSSGKKRHHLLPSKVVGVGLFSLSLSQTPIPTVVKRRQIRSETKPRLARARRKHRREIQIVSDSLGNSFGRPCLRFQACAQWGLRNRTKDNVQRLSKHGDTRRIRRFRETFVGIK
jgi:hypothetical protein